MTRFTCLFRIISGQVLTKFHLLALDLGELVHEWFLKLNTSEETKLIRRSMQTGTRRSGWQSTPCGVPPRKAFMCIRMLC